MKKELISESASFIICIIIIILSWKIFYEFLPNIPIKDTSKLWILLLVQMFIGYFQGVGISTLQEPIKNIILKLLNICTKEN